MITLFVTVGIALIIFGGILLVRPGVIAAIESVGVKVSAPVGLIIMIIGAAGVWYPLSPYYKPSALDEAPNRPSSASGHVAMRPTAGTPIQISFTSPRDGAVVGGRFSVDGTAPDLGKDKLWLLAWAKNPTIQSMAYYRVLNTPLNIENGTWSASIEPPGDVGEEIITPFQLRLVRATPWCSNKLAQVKSNSSGEFVIPALPPGCVDTVQPLAVKKSS
ncbi:MAG TPA: hypothetical protein VFO16_18135 [Pseudonocardiaceae bacterium]|nr:hypothetical protein [Pseudonocardiaceae bacterium]